MFFFCQDTKVYNYEYHYECSRNPIQKKKNNGLNKINSLKMKPRSKQSSQRSPSEDVNQGLTLLQKLRRRSQSLQTTLYATCNNKMTQQKSSTNAQTVLTVLYNNKTNKTWGSIQENKNIYFNNQSNFSFCVPRQILDSQTFHKQVTQSQNNCIIEQQSQLIQPTINGKFIYISCTLSMKDYQQHIGIDTQLGVLASVKQIKGQNEQRIYKQLEIYNKIGRHPNILDLYQICFHQKKQIIIKQPYVTIKPSIQDKDQICKDITNALQYLQKFQIYLDFIYVQDIRQSFGVWKLSNFPINLFKKLSISQNVRQLLAQIQ